MLALQVSVGFSVPPIPESRGEAPPPVARVAGWACPCVVPSLDGGPGSPVRLLEAQGPGGRSHLAGTSSRLLDTFFAAFRAGLVAAVFPHSLHAGLEVERVPQWRCLSSSRGGPRQQLCSFPAACRVHLRKPSLPELGTQTSQQPPFSTGPLGAPAGLQAGEPTHLSARRARGVLAGRGFPLPAGGTGHAQLSCGQSVT